MKRDMKICGLKSEEAVRAAVDGGATHIGFIFFPKSPRNIDPADAGALADAVRSRVKVVAVTVDADNDFLDEIVAMTRPDMLQLHGHESPERVLNVKAVYGLPVIKAMPVREADDLKKVGPYIGIADRFLFDAKPPAGADLPGGNGVSFDWKLMHLLDDDVDYMLSGGLNKDNIAEALAVTRAPGIDVSSGVESAPGVKDVGMIEAFFDAVAHADVPASVAGRAT